MLEKRLSIIKGQGVDEVSENVESKNDEQDFQESKNDEQESQEKETKILENSKNVEEKEPEILSFE
jgi:hypothetical protein